MTDQPSEAALRKACGVLECNYPGNVNAYTVIKLARHFDAEDKAAREALSFICRPEKTAVLSVLTDFTRRHILPDPKPTVRDILLDKTLGIAGKEQALRDAGLLRECG